MTAKQELSRFVIKKQQAAEAEAIMRARLDKDAEKILTLKSSLILPSIALDGMPHGHASKDKIAEVLAEIDLILRAAQERVDKVMTMQNEAFIIMGEIYAEIQKVHNATYRLLLIRRFINNLSWTQVADVLSKDCGKDYSPSYVRNNLQYKALKAFEEANKC